MVKNSTDAMKDYWALDYANMVMLFQNHKFVTTDFLRSKGQLGTVSTVKFIISALFKLLGKLIVYQFYNMPNMI